MKANKEELEIPASVFTTPACAVNKHSYHVYQNINNFHAINALYKIHSHAYMIIHLYHISKTIQIIQVL